MPSGSGEYIMNEQPEQKILLAIIQGQDLDLCADALSEAKIETNRIRVRFYINDVDRQKNVLDRLLAWCGKFLQIYDYQKQENDKMAALHAKLIVVDRLTSLVSSANLSYHGMHGNIEMGVLMTSAEKAVKIEDLLNELVRMKIFVLHRQDS